MHYVLVAGGNIVLDSEIQGKRVHGSKLQLKQALFQDLKNYCKPNGDAPLEQRRLHMQFTLVPLSA